jgi:hypothetical protein
MISTQSSTNVVSLTFIQLPMSSIAAAVAEGHVDLAHLCMVLVALTDHFALVPFAKISSVAVCGVFLWSQHIFRPHLRLGRILAELIFDMISELLLSPSHPSSQ